MKLLHMETEGIPLNRKKKGKCQGDSEGQLRGVYRRKDAKRASSTFMSRPRLRRKAPRLEQFCFSMFTSHARLPRARISRSTTQDHGRTEDQRLAQAALRTKRMRKGLAPIKVPESFTKRLPRLPSCRRHVFFQLVPNMSRPKQTLELKPVLSVYLESG